MITCDRSILISQYGNGVYEVEFKNPRKVTFRNPTRSSKRRLNVLVDKKATKVLVNLYLYIDVFVLFPGKVTK